MRDAGEQVGSDQITRSFFELDPRAVERKPYRDGGPRTGVARPVPSMHAAAAADAGYRDARTAASI